MDPQGLVFAYDLGLVALAGNGVGNAQVQVLDWDFMALFLVANSTGRFTAQVIDSGTKFQWSNQQIIDTNLFGTAQNPFPLLVPYTFKKRGQIQVALTDLSGAPNNVRITIHGINLLS